MTPRSNSASSPEDGTAEAEQLSEGVLSRGGERVDGATDEHGDDRQRDDRLGHREHLRPPTEDRRVRGAEGRASVEREEEVVHEARRPAARHRPALGHLGEEEVLAVVTVPVGRLAGPPPSISQYQTAKVTTFIAQMSAASPRRAGAGVPPPSDTRIRSSALVATAMVTRATSASANRQASRRRPPTWADMSAATSRATRTGTKSRGPGVSSVDTAAYRAPTASNAAAAGQRGTPFRGTRSPDPVGFAAPLRQPPRFVRHLFNAFAYYPRARRWRLSLTYIGQLRPQKRVSPYVKRGDSPQTKAPGTPNTPPAMSQFKGRPVPGSPSILRVVSPV